jgi:hypothetical protein
MTADNPGFGPWAAATEAERQKRWREMAALTLVYCGGAHELLRACITAEVNPAFEAAAARALESLSALPRRRLLSAVAALDALTERTFAASSPRRLDRRATGRRKDR